MAKKSISKNKIGNNGKNNGQKGYNEFERLEFRKIIEEKMLECNETIESLKATTLQPVNVQCGNNPFMEVEECGGDQGEVQKNIFLLSRANKYMKELEAAHKRTFTENFGKDKDGNLIDPNRLKAVPTTQTNIINGVKPKHIKN